MLRAVHCHDVDETPRCGSGEREEADAGAFFFTESMRRYCLPVSIELLSGSDGDATRINRIKSSLKFNPF